jgi:DNA-nicking Smr family endonuclease
MPKPFQKLGDLFGISRRQSSLKDEPPPFKVKSWEEVLFMVKPFREKNFYYSHSPKKPAQTRNEDWPPQKIEIKLPLTSEYIEGRRSYVSPETLRKLKEGYFSIQASLNLRGLFLEEARLLFEDFMESALRKGLSCVLIIHGRGLSSKGEPVLKRKVREWLERGPFRRFVLAYASARPCDGGLGATYVLLSSRPFKR